MLASTYRNRALWVVLFFAVALAQAAAPEVALADEPDSETVTEGASSEASEEAEEDSGGLDWFWLEASAGFVSANLVSFENDNYAPSITSTSGHGFGGTFGLGVNVLFLRFGARAALATHGDFNIGSAAVEMNIDIPLIVLDLWIRAGFGFTWIGSVGITGPGDDEPTLNGWCAPLGLGINIPIGDTFYVGAGGELVLMRTTRNALTDVGAVTDVDLTEGGDAFGYQLRTSVQVGVTF